MTQVLVAAGSNIEPGRHLAVAMRELAREFPGVRFSPAYRNAAVGFAGEDFINLVAAFDSEWPPAAILELLHTIEARCGRERAAPKWAPRSMDLDLLLYGDLVHESPGLRLPRPDLLKRPYMLGPAADVAPGMRHPTAGLTLAELWSRFDRGAHALVPVPLAPAREEP
jgi:2-amino-4-hydroxy-6-hydroxymethyldihydropteridine diphosphokinase